MEHGYAKLARGPGSVAAVLHDDSEPRASRLAEIRRGRGIFVASPRIVQELTELTSFVEDMKVLGRIPTVRVLSREFVPVEPSVAEKLTIPAGTTAVHRLYQRSRIPLSALQLLHGRLTCLLFEFCLEPLQRYRSS